MAQQLMPAGVQVAALQAEVPDVPLPYSITLPHTDMLITAHRAVCFMGDRHINIFGLTQAADAQSGAPPSESNAAKRARVASSAAQSAVPAAEAPEARGSALLAEAVNGEPRAQLTCEQATELVAAAAYNHAAPIIKLLPSYLHPLLATAPMSEVRSLFINRCLGDTQCFF